MSLQIGLPQNNRVGDLDPYVIRYLEAQGISEEEIFETMTKKSGLLGVSGVGRDLRYLMDAAKEGNGRAQLAIDMFIDSILHYIGAYAAEMGGLDNLVFTGGIGENSEYVREKVCEKLAATSANFSASIVDIAKSITKKHSRRFIRSAKVDCHAGAPLGGSSSLRLATTLRLPLLRRRRIRDHPVPGTTLISPL